MNIAFKHPDFLYFLFAIAIPIIIHLFSFRRYKNVYFHNIYLLKNIETEQNRTKSKLKQILILCSRILTIIFLVFAFAQPYIPNSAAKQTTPTQNNIIALYIDNSFSSQSESSNGMILEYAKTKAQLIVDAFNATKKFYLITHSDNGLQNVILTKEQIKQEISKITVSAYSQNLSEIIKQIQTIRIQQKIPITVYAISDFQKNSSDFANIPNDTLLPVNLVPIEAKTSKNLYIDSCWFSTPYRLSSQPEKLFVSITNTADESYTNIPLKLFVNDSLKAISNFSIKPNQTNTIAIDYSTNASGIISARIEIEDYPIVYDNSYFFSYTISPQIPVLQIFGKQENKNIQALFKKNKFFTIQSQSIDAIDYARLSQNSVLILDNIQSISSGLTQTIISFLESGKSVICIPHENLDISNFNTFLVNFGNQKIESIDTSKTEISMVDYSHIIFKNVFEKQANAIKLPVVSKHFPLALFNAGNTIISLKNKNPFLVEYTNHKGSFYLFTSPLHTKSNNFVAHPLFVGLYNMALFVASSNQIQTYLGNPYRIMLQNYSTDQVFHIVNKEKNIDFIPQISADYSNAQFSLNPMKTIQKSGNYFIETNNKIVTGISYNYNRKESDLSFYSIDEITQILEENSLEQTKIISANDNLLSQNIAEVNLGYQLWRIMIFITLLFIIIEVLLIRYLK